MCHSVQNGLNALHLASKEGHVNVVTELLNRGAVVDAATKVRRTATVLILSRFRLYVYFLLLTNACQQANIESKPVVIIRCLGALASSHSVQLYVHTTFVA